MRPIDADALKATMIETLEQIKANPKMDGQEMHIIAGIAMLGEMVDDSPTIDAVPVVRGKWIIHKPFDYGRHNCNECIECSVCGTWFGHDCYEISNFCPNCGADMRVSPKLLIYDDTNINIGKKNFTESGKLHTIDKECARRYLEGKIFFGFIIDAFNRIINRINEIEDVINQIRGLNFCPNCGADMREDADHEM